MDPKTYRNVIGHFASGVTVITTNVDGLLHGMTASAVCSVSLDPILLLVCVDQQANCYEQLRASAYFGVNILAEGQDAVSNEFANKSDPEPDRLRGFRYEVSANGVPLLVESLARIECRMHQRIPAGDHDIFLGEVLEASVAAGRPRPLLYYSSAYHRIEG